MKIGIGTKIFSVREYPANSRRELVITGETARSWVVEEYGREVFKIPKSHTGETFTEHVSRGRNYGGATWYFNEEAFERNQWVVRNQHRIGEAVRRIDDYDLLKKVAELIGYEEEAGRTKR